MPSQRIDRKRDVFVETNRDKKAAKRYALITITRNSPYEIFAVFTVSPAHRAHQRIFVFLFPPRGPNLDQH